MTYPQLTKTIQCGIIGYNLKQQKSIKRRYKDETKALSKPPEPCYP